jgi:hypothetical protein
VRIEIGRESMSRVLRLEVGGDEEQGGAAGVRVWRMGKLGFLVFI